MPRGLAVYETAGEELGPIDYLIVVFPSRTTSLAGAMATELASLVDAELIRVLDLVVVEKGADGDYEVREFEDLRENHALGDLHALKGQLAEVLAVEDLECVVASLEAGTTAAIVVLENSWAAPFAAAARRSGGQLAADGRIPMHELIDALDPKSRPRAEANTTSCAALRPGRIGRAGVIARPLTPTSNVAGAAEVVIRAVERRGDWKRSSD
jgi:hypothetical protein